MAHSFTNLTTNFTLIVNGVNMMEDFVVDGVNYGPPVQLEGIKWQRSDADGPGAGRQLDGDMRRDRIGEKRRLDVTCRPLWAVEAAYVLSAITPEEFTVTYTDVQAGTTRTCQMYSNNYSGGFKFKRRRDGAELWAGITFPLIEM